VIAAIAFRNFKALRATSVRLAPFNLVIGPNGSGKTSLIEAVLRLRTLAGLPLSSRRAAHKPGSPEIEFTFAPPHAAITAHVGCISETVCDSLAIEPPDAPGWPALQEELRHMRGYVLEHGAMGAPARRDRADVLSPDGSNLAAFLAGIRERAPTAFSELAGEMLRITPEFRSLELLEHADDRVELQLRLAENGIVPAIELSQGMLYLLALLALAFDPTPPRVLCIEEVDRGFHPRMLREVRDLLYRLSHPEAVGLARHPVQIVATTHSPYLIDQFREHPDEIVITQKHGRAARLERLSDRADLPELMREGSLGDMWFSGILGGIPEERS
jgi:predicted ATPase